jgi:hypothetical protein
LSYALRAVSDGAAHKVKYPVLAKLESTDHHPAIFHNWTIAMTAQATTIVK